MNIMNVRYVYHINIGFSKYFYVALDHKTSHKCEFFKMWIIWINNIFSDVWFVRIRQYLAEIQLCESLESVCKKKKSKYWEHRL